jgi:hypothetical protein
MVTVQLSHAPAAKLNESITEENAIVTMLPYRTTLGKLHKSSGATGPCILAHDQIGGCGAKALAQWRT